MRLRDKAVIVPGGGKGIGLRYLRGFAAESAAVAVSEIDASAHSSGTARKGSAGFLHYVTSKAAIAGSTDGPGPFGAKAIGESSNILTAAAIANAVFDACGMCETELPLTAEKSSPDWLTNSAVDPARRIAPRTDSPGVAMQEDSL